MLIGILLIAAGIVLWVNPTHRVFYGIAGIVLGIISFPASNLGGFVLGMLLAIIGGALAFAWVPAEPDSVDAKPGGRAGDDAPAGRATTMLPRAWTAGDEERPSARPRPGRRNAARAEWEGTATIAEEAASGSRWRRPSRRRRGRAAPDAGGRRDAGPAGGRDARHQRGGQGGVTRSPTVTASSASSACRRRRRPRPRRPPPPRRPRRRPRRPRRRSTPARLRRPRSVSPGPCAVGDADADDVGERLAVPERHVDHRSRRQGQEGRREARRRAVGHHRLGRRLGAHGRVGHPDRLPVPGQRKRACRRRDDRRDDGVHRQLGRPVGRRHRVGHPGRADHGHQQPVARVRRRHDALRDQALRRLSASSRSASPRRR